MQIFSTDFAHYKEIAESFEFSGPYLSAYLIIIAAVAFFSLVMYVIHGTAFYFIAKKRKMKNPYMSFIPILNVFQIGSVADHINYNSERKQKSFYEKWLVATVSFCLLFVILAVIFCVNGYSKESAKMIIAAIVLLLISLAFGVACSVILFIAFYDIYKDYAPESAVVYTVFTIFFSYLAPVCALLLINKDSISMKNARD